MNERKREFVNKRECDILKYLSGNAFENQRKVAETAGYAVGVVNQALKLLENRNLINSDKTLTVKGCEIIKETSPCRAIILAAGFGMRMVPINFEVPKALLEVHGEPLIERTIKQLHEVGIEEIHVVTGFMKEKFEYLIDEYGVDLIVNKDYSTTNNLHSLSLARDFLNNAYIIPCDIWMDRNPYSKVEFYSWYMVDEHKNHSGSLKVNRRLELVKSSSIISGVHEVGICYLTGEASAKVKERLSLFDADSVNANKFWEDVLYSEPSIKLYANRIPADSYVEINTYEQLRDFDAGSDHLKSGAICIAADSLNASTTDIVNIEILKKGMTNRSFLFSCRDKRYIMRIPGEGTDQLINRKEEADVYRVLNDKNICDNVIYMNPDNGYKITEFIESSRVCDPMNASDVRDCMKRLRDFHNLRLKVNHTFDIFKQINFYESLWNGNPSVYRDYQTTKDNVLSLKPYIDTHAKAYALTHIDAVPDNFLFSNENLKKQIHIIDWEYAGMQDQDVDLAMFCIYAMYDRKHVDKLIDAYYTEGCSVEIRVKIYCYIATCGLLWSNWCEFKRNLGVDFGEYALRQYRYAKEYYRIVKDLLDGNTEVSG